MQKFLISGIWRYILVVIIFTVIIEGTWFFMIIPEHEKLPLDFKSFIEHEGEDQIAQNSFEEMSPPFRLQESLIQKVIAVDGNILTVQSSVKGIRADTAEVIFESNKEYHINRITYMHSDMDNRHFGFLPNVEKQNYEFLHPLIFNDATLIFQEVEKLNGLEVYVFTAQTRANDISFAFPQFAPNTIFSDTFSKLWVEPITGNVIKFEKEWEDYILVNEVQRKPIQKGWKKTTEFTESILIDNAMIKIENFTFYRIFMPIFLGILFLGMGSFIVILASYISTQKKIANKSRLEILGNLTARISHDIRNPLSSIKMSANLIKLKENPSPSIIERLEIIDQGVSRISHQVDNVLDFVRPSKFHIENIDLKTIIESSIKNVDIPDEIKVSIHVKNTEFFADFHQIETALINIITNAVQAIKQKGEIEITANENNRKIIFQIKDSGKGISERDLEKIFDPLFTTKQEGTGLGLFSCKMIVENHNGKIMVSNNPTTFTITLPKFHEKNVELE